MVISKVEQRTIAVSYYIEIEEEYYKELIIENKYNNGIVKNAIAYQFQKSGLIREYEEMNKHEWIWKDIKAENKMEFRVSYHAEEDELKYY